MAAERELPPEWQWALRVFFSADLLDSSTLKHRGSDHWVPTIRGFFEEIQKLAEASITLLQARSPIPAVQAPSLNPWKANGDEMLWECEVKSLGQAILAESAFRRAITHFNEDVEASQNPDARHVRGTSWAAGFPLRNRRLRVGVEYDFIGPQMDLGFRLTKFDGHHPDLVVTSPEMTWLLARGAEIWPELDVPMRYCGRKVFKGAAGGMAVPVFCTDTKRAEEPTLEDRLRGLSQRPRCRTEDARTSVERFLRSNDKWPYMPFVVGDGHVAPPDELLSILDEQRMSQMRNESAPQYGDDAMGRDQPA